MVVAVGGVGLGGLGGGATGDGGRLDRGYVRQSTELTDSEDGRTYIALMLSGQNGVVFQCSMLTVRRVTEDRSKVIK